MRYLLSLVVCLLTMSYSLLSFAEWRDPTRPDGFNSVVEEDPMRLNAIIISKERRIAVISGKMLKIGDQFEGSLVTSIEPNTVQLEGRDGRITLHLVSQAIKQPTLNQG